jgi:outer membrane lipoprotein-sorting protein
MRRIGLAVVVAIAVCAATRVEAQGLRDFLQAVEAEATLAAPLRADGTIEINSGDKTKRDQIILVMRPPGDTYIELREIGTRVLLLDAGGPAAQLIEGAAHSTEIAAGAALADSDFSREDLQPFRLARFSDTRIADDSSGQLTVSLFPTASPYTLLVTTFDREKKAALKTIYYRDTLNNAVKMRRDSGYVLVGRKWLPTTITMETFRLQSHTTLTLHWTQNPTFPAELFDPAFLTHPSPLVWPAPPGAGQ